MCAARHDMIEIACGCAAHTVFALPVAPQLFRCRGGGLSRGHTKILLLDIFRPMLSKCQAEKDRRLIVATLV